MSSAELMEWAAFEQVHGPILVHDRVDFGLTQVALILANAFSKRRVDIKKVLPPWHRQQQRSDASVAKALERMMGAALAND